MEPLSSKRTSRKYASRDPIETGGHSHANTKLCIDCGSPIPLDRLEANPSTRRCILCQALLEARDPSLTQRRMDGGLAGTREDHKKMRARQWGDMQSRRRE
ncbi:MAG: TraR/DksA C4-type zinc finger protein [Gammaproteobacteria bacterium]